MQWLNNNSVGPILTYHMKENRYARVGRSNLLIWFLFIYCLSITKTSFSIYFFYNKHVKYLPLPCSTYCIFYVQWNKKTNKLTFGYRCLSICPSVIFVMDVSQTDTVVRVICYCRLHVINQISNTRHPYWIVFSSYLSKDTPFLPETRIFFFLGKKLWIRNACYYLTHQN